MRFLVPLAAAAIAGCTSIPNQRVEEVAVAAAPDPSPPTASTAGREAATGPLVDHHQHLLSPAMAEMLGGKAEEVNLPAELHRLLGRRTAAWNDPKQLAPLYAENAMLVENEEVVGRKAVSEHVGTRFARPYDITPVAFSSAGSARQLAALYTRGAGADQQTVGVTLMTFTRDAQGRWLIASESMKFPGPGSYAPIDADRLVQFLDQAEIGRAVVLSIAYLFESPRRAGLANAAGKLRAENDWTAAQVARHPDRLIGFCSVNPLTDTALSEIERCARELHLKGLKLHFANSDVEVKTPEHLAKIQQVFALANRLKLPIVAHLWTGEEYGRAEAEIFRDQILPQAPDVVVQIAHMAGAGPGWTDEALEVFATAVEEGDPQTGKLYFDLATVADLQRNEQLELLARRIRQIGPQRILYGSDSAFGGNRPPNEEWGTFRGMVPLTDAEFAIIRDNVAPYLR
jgi:predicted TIM-barrel fold metal-dependent hydrolase